MSLAAIAAMPVGAADRAAAADQALPAVVVGVDEALVSNVPDALPWGVVGIGSAAHISTDLRVQVFALAEYGERIYVGGMFARAQHGPGGRSVDQPYLAAFDRITGEFVESFRPVLDAPVYALAVTSDGKLVVGGEFESVNGASYTTGLAALDPATGAVIGSWRSHLERPWSGEFPVVRAIEIHGGRVYAAGNFSHQTSPSARTRVYKVIRVSESDGTLDRGWLPQVTGAGIWSMAVSPDGSRVTLGGYQSAIDGDTDAKWIGVVDGVTGARVPSFVHQRTHNSSAHVQAIADTGDRLYYSGSQHYIFSYDTTSWQRLDGTTYTPGGDGQAIEIADGIIYNACHCLEGNAWTDSYTWPTPSNGSVRHRVNAISAHDVDGFGYHDDFWPEIFYEDGDGPWDLLMDAGGCLWVGGDVYRIDVVEPYRWARGFTRLCRDDATAPSAPRRLEATATGPGDSEVTLTWRRSTDDRAVVGYQILRDGELVDTVSDLSWVDPDPGIGVVTYRVRAVDARGNLSSTSDPATASPAAPPATYIAEGATWHYLDTGVAPAAGWTGVAFDDGAWRTGTAPLGFGDGDESTVISIGHVEQWFRHRFNVTDASVDALELRLQVDDGAVVYLNGTELAREAMPAGTLSSPAWPTAWKAGADEQAWTTFTVPASALSTGSNVVAVSVHNISAGNSDLSFDLSLRESTLTPEATARTVVAAGDTWRYLDTGVAPAPNWTDPEFDDTAWATGSGEFGYGDGDEATLLTEGSPRFVTHWFRHDFSVADPARFSSITLSLVRDDGAVVYLNGVELIRDQMPAGPVTASTLASAYAAGPDESAPHVFSVPASALRTGANVVSVEVHSADTGSKDLSFDLAVTLEP